MTAALVGVDHLLADMMIDATMTVAAVTGMTDTLPLDMTIVALDTMIDLDIPMTGATGEIGLRMGNENAILTIDHLRETIITRVDRFCMILVDICRSGWIDQQPRSHLIQTDMLE